MAAKRISIAALCDDQPRRHSAASASASASDSPGLPLSSARRPSESSSSDASSSSASVAPLLHGSSPTRTSSAAYDPIRDADNRHDDPQSKSTRPISSPPPPPPPPPPSAHVRQPPQPLPLPLPLAPTQTQHSSRPHYTPIAPRPGPGPGPGAVSVSSVPSVSVRVRNASTSSTSPPTPNPNLTSPPNPSNPSPSPSPNAPAPSARPAQHQTRLLAIPPNTRYSPYPHPHPQQPFKQTLAYSTLVSPSSRTDLLSNNGPIAFEIWDPNNVAGSSTSRRSSKSKANRNSPSSSSVVGKPGPSPTNMSASKKSKSKSKVAAVGQEEASAASNTPGGVVRGSNTREEREEVMPNTAARSTSPSGSGSGSGGRPPTPGAASNANSSTIDDALDVEMELLGALGGDEETRVRVESASLGARGPPVTVNVKLDRQTTTTTAEDDLLDEVEAMERAAAHKPAKKTPSMRSPMKHEREREEGDAMEIDVKRPSPAIPAASLQPPQLPSRTLSHTAPTSTPTPIPISAPHSQPTSASHSLRPTPSPARTPTPTTAPANLPAPLPPANTKKGSSKGTAGAAKASAASSKNRTAKATAARKKQNHPSANELLKVGSTKSKGVIGGSGPSSSSTVGPGVGGVGGVGSFAFHGTSSGRAAAAAATASFGAVLDVDDDGYGDQRDSTEYRPDAAPTAKGQVGGGEDDSEEEIDMRLYCVCRQLYDDRFMLGCENCDDWFHPICVQLAEHQCDLLEHFYCEACQRADPNLKIVWRHRCANGQRHPAPDSSDACWRAAHPPMSKYCSKECGIEAVERRLLPYAKQKAGLRLEADERDEGVKREMNRLFAGVRERKRREAVVLKVDDDDTGAGAVKREPGTTDGATGARNRDKGLVIPPGMVVQSPGSRLESDLAALQHDLEETRCELKMRTRELSFILARARLVKLAVSWSDKPENVQKCCFDSRMLMDGEDWEEWVEGEGRSVLEGVSDDGSVPTIPTVIPTPTPIPPPPVLQPRPNGREVRVEQEGQTTPPEGEESGLEEEMGVEDEDSPWCDGRRKCERHAGWQKLQIAECDLNRGIKELIISRLKDRGEHLRIRIKCIHTALESSQQGQKTAEKDSDSVMLDVV